MKINKIIDGKKYFKSGTNKKHYNIYICNSKEQISEMINFINNVLDSKQKQKQIYLGIDFEFNNINNNREIALCQINIENNNSGNVFLFYPLDLDNYQTKSFINLLTDVDIIKILHGGESLDIPYLFKNILKDNKDRIKFCSNLIDTRYLCEYYYLKKNEKNFKCKINYVLLELNVIDKKIFNLLAKVEEDMGPIYNIIIDVNNLDELLIMYTVTDVLYLPKLVDNFLKNKKLEVNLVKNITSYIFLQKDNIDKSLVILNSYNNFYLKSNDYRKISLSELYNHAKYMIIDNKFNVLSEINYFKKFLEFLLKYFLYTELINNFEVWENKNNKFKYSLNNNLDKINYTFYFKELNYYCINIIKNQIIEILKY
jgi:hypothetical protein